MFSKDFEIKIIREANFSSSWTKNSKTVLVVALFKLPCTFPYHSTKPDCLIPIQLPKNDNAQIKWQLHNRSV